MSTASNQATEYVVCINNSDYPASLELHKIYKFIPDEEVAQDGEIRVIDESGEDYIYSVERFAYIEVPAEVINSFEHAA